MGNATANIYPMVDGMLHPQEPFAQPDELIRVPEGDPLLAALIREHGPYQPPTKKE